jgi:hypothetical protein
MKQQSTKQPSEDGVGVNDTSLDTGKIESVKEQQSDEMCDEYLGGKQKDFFAMIGELDPVTDEGIEHALNAVIDSVYHDGLADAQLPEDKRCIKSRSDFTTCNCFAVIDVKRMGIVHVIKDVEMAGKFVDHVILPDLEEEWLEAHPEHEGKRLPEEERKALLKQFIIVECTIRLAPEAKVWAADE